MLFLLLIEEPKGPVKDEVEDCVLKAIDTGEGYTLYVEDADGKAIALLRWPESWPDIVSPAYLEVAGFKIVPA